MEILEKIKEVVKLLDELEDYDNDLPSKQSDIDQRISDIYHYVENTRMTTKNSYRVVKELKTLLLERREFKQDQSLLATFENNKAKLNLKSNRAMMLADMHKAQKNLDTEYKFRIYDKDEFVKQMEG